MFFRTSSCALRAFTGAFLVLTFFTPLAHAAKNHCRKISFDGVAGVLSQDVVNFQVARPDASVVNLSDTFQVQPNESAIDFLKRLPSVWCTEDGAVCPSYDPLNLPKKICADSLGAPSCSLKLKIAPKNGPTYKKKYVEVCCFEQPLCKGKLGKTNPAEVPITIQAQVNAGAECPPDYQLPSGVSTCTVNLDPIGIIQYPHAALGKCRSSVAKSLSSYFNVATFGLVKCHVGRDEGKLPDTTDCNSFTATDPNIAGQIAGAAASLSATLQNCGNDGSPASYGYGGCPAPCESVSTGDCTAGLVGQPCSGDRDCDTGTGSLDGRCGDWAGVADCLSCLTENAVTTAVSDKLGNPPAPVVDGGVLQCRRSLAKLLADVVSTRLKETSSCQKKLDAGKLVLPEGTACKDYDAKGALAALQAKVTDTLNKGCTGVDLTQVESCSTTDLVSLAACFVANGDLVNDAFAGAAFPELRPQSAGTCPTSLRLLAAAGIGHACNDDADCIPGNCVSGRCANPTEFDLGSSGLFHGSDINDGAALDLGVSCAASEAPCGTCTITGIDAAKRSMCRCSNDAGLSCDQPFAPDSDDCGGAQCECFAGAPLPLSSGGSAMCVTRRLEGEPGGVIDVDTSTLALDLVERWHVHLPESLTAPCPQCVAASCTSGLRAGLPCIASETNATLGSTSLDCPPLPGADVSGGGLLLTSSESTGTASLGSGIPCDAPFIGSLCPCAVCSLDPTIGCSNDSQCPPGTGTCSESGAGQRIPNSCNDSTCSPTGDPTRGVCGAGPIDTYCDGITHGDGRGLLTCLTNADCAAFGSEAGNCTLSANRSCFLDQIQAAGFAAVSTARAVSTTCLAPSQSAAINVNAGLPGALRRSTLYRPILECGDGVSQYVPAVGGCP